MPHLGAFWSILIGSIQTPYDNISFTCTHQAGTPDPFRALLPTQDHDLP